MTYRTSQPFSPDNVSTLLTVITTGLSLYRLSNCIVWVITFIPVPVPRLELEGL